MLRAGGPQAGQHGDRRAVIVFGGVGSALRADPRAPPAQVNPAGSPSQSQSRGFSSVTEETRNSRLIWPGPPEELFFPSPFGDTEIIRFRFTMTGDPLGLAS